MKKARRSSSGLLKTNYDCVVSEAGISSCKKYRWWLHRVWDPSLPLVIWVMLNPSTADHRKNDPTIMKVMRYSKRWGYGGILVLNIYAYRTSRPENLPDDENLRVGYRNDSFIRSMFQYAKAEGIAVVCAWGAKHRERGCRVRRMAADLGLPLLGLEVALNGEPKHPRFLSETLCPRRI